MVWRAWSFFIMFIVLINSLGGSIPKVFAADHASASQSLSAETASPKTAVLNACGHNSSQDQTDCENEQCLIHHCHLGHCSFLTKNSNPGLRRQPAELFLSIEEKLLFSVKLPISGKPPKFN